MGNLFFFAWLILGGLNTSAQAQLSCGAERLVTQNSGQPLYLPPGKVRFTHLWVGTGQLPRLAYIKRVSLVGLQPSDLTHQIRIKEGGADFILSTADDSEYALNSSLLNQYVSPNIIDYSIFDRFVILSVTDGRISVPPLSRQSSQVILIELGAGGTVVQEKVVANYPVTVSIWNEVTTERASKVHIDHALDPRTSFPLVSWYDTIDLSRVGATDQIYYCVFDQCPAMLPQPNYLTGTTGTSAQFFLNTLWVKLVGHFVTLANTTLAQPTVMATAIVQQVGGPPATIGGRFSDLGIYAKDANPGQTQGSIYAWDDGLTTTGGFQFPLNERLVGYSDSFVYYTKPNQAGKERIHATLQFLPPQLGTAPILVHDPTGSVGTDRNLLISNSLGHSFQSYQGQLNPPETFMMWENLTATHMIPITHEKVDLAELNISTATAFPNAVPLGQLINLPPHFGIYGIAVSQNVFIAGGMPDPAYYTDPAYLQLFRTPQGDLMSFMFYCAI